jgi:proliferating cell nuclear antigen
MLLKTDHPKILSDVISIISELVTEVKIKINSSGMSIIAIDPANVALVSFTVPNSLFSQFKVDREETIGANLENLKLVLRRCHPASKLVLETEDNMLVIEIIDKVKRIFRLAMIDIESEDKALPSLEFKNKIEINSVDFSEAIEDCNIVADSCSFGVENGSFVIEAKGALNSAKSEFSSDEVDILNPSESVRSKYSLEYLQKFNKASRMTDTTIIEFSNDYPLKLEYIFQGAALIFILAPRVETED